MNYSQALEYLYNRLPVFHLQGGNAYKPGLDNTVRLLEGLGNPHLKFKSIHIAGTNGKGSVSNMLAAVLQTSNLKTGLYTSPHLVDFGERIRINGQMIDKDFVVDFVEKTKDLVATISPSFFELTMAMAFDYFALNGVEIAVIEAGLGGRLDSTNILNPELSIITNIALDHTEFLGDNLSKIAFEKAGIIKQNTPVVVGEYLPETKKVFFEKALEKSAPVYFVQDLFSTEILKTVSTKLQVSVDSHIYKLDLQGEYQAKNLPTVLKAIEILKNKGFDLKNESAALENVSVLTGLRGRWEILSENPRIIVDTAHNCNGLELVVEQVSKMKFNALHIITGVVKDKDLDGILELLPEYAKYYFTQASTPRALDADILKKRAEAYKLSGTAYPVLNDAIKTALNAYSENDLILILGSNFVVGEALQYPFTF